MITGRHIRTERMLVLGQAPGRGQGEALSGRCGERLASLIGFTVDEMHERFEVRNLLGYYPGSNGRGDLFPTREARQAAARLDLSRYCVVLVVGVAVARALGLGSKPKLEWFDLDGTTVGIVPHPSGLNRWWNDARNVQSARRFLGLLQHGSNFLSDA